MKSSLLTVLLASLVSGASQAQVIVADSGLTVPVVGANDTGFLGTTSSRFGWDAGEGATQTFTLPAAGFIQSIFLGYNAFDDGEAITFDLSVNNNLVASGIVLSGDDFSGNSATDDNFAESYWMEFDLSAENVVVAEGLNSFTLVATADTGENWAFAPRYILDGGYPGGAMAIDFGNTGGDSDLAFAVTVGAPTVPVDLRVTSTAFDTAGNFVINFAGKTNANYEVVKSLGLASGSFASLGTPLIVATDGNGAGQVTVPAGEATEDQSFFRVEERP